MGQFPAKSIWDILLQIAHYMWDNFYFKYTIAFNWEHFDSVKSNQIGDHYKIDASFFKHTEIYLERVSFNRHITRTLHNYGKCYGRYLDAPLQKECINFELRKCFDSLDILS